MNNKPQAAYFSLLEAVAVAANQSETPAEAFDTVLEHICNATDWPVGHPLIVDSENQLQPLPIWCVTDAHLPDAFAEFQAASNTQRFSNGEGLPGRVLASEQAEWIADLSADDNFPRKRIAMNAGLVACLAFPIKSGTRIVGVIEFYARRPQNPDPEFLKIMSQVGLQLGRAFERNAAREQLAASEKSTREILDSTSDAFIGMDADDRITEWNKAAEFMFGWRREEILGQRVSDTIIPSQYKHDHQRGVQRFLATGIPKVLGKRLELSAVNRDQHEFPIEISQWTLETKNDWRFYAFIRDITQRKKSEMALERRANYDELTGAPNRNFILGKLTQLLQQPRDVSDRPAVLCLNLDRFKWVNDSLGHAAGDRVLTVIAERLRLAVRPPNMIGRLASDDFVVICPDTEEADDAKNVAEKLLVAVAQPLQIEEDQIFLTARLGIAFAHADSNAESLISSADMAMSRAKVSGPGHYELFDEDMRLTVLSRLHIEKELSDALERNQFRLYFQAIVGAKREQVAGVEALLRWEHPERGLISPMEFIPIAEETGLIVPIGAWVLEEAYRCAAGWDQSGLLTKPLYVSVNLSARQLAQSNLMSLVERILATYQARPSNIRLGLEITETIVMRDPDTAIEMLQTLGGLGIHLSIDDFGTGYSSLAYLKNFPVNVIKIDMSFVRNIVKNPVDRAIVRSVTELARILGLQVVAEGVETIEQRDVLRDIGVDLFQGFLYSRPQPAGEFTQTLTGC